MQSATVGNIIESLISGAESNDLLSVVKFLVNKRNSAMMTGLERKAAMKDKGGLSNDFEVLSS
jgi:hypothetical protein